MAVNNVTLHDCAMVSVSAGPDAAPWSDEAVELLSSFRFSTTIDLQLPDGWSVVAIGPELERYSMEFYDASLGTVRLIQLPGSSAGPMLAGLAGLPIEAVRVGDTDGWLVTGETFTALIWSSDIGAVLLGDDHASIEQLTQIALTLEHGTADEWTQRYGALTELAQLSYPNPTCLPPPVTLNGQPITATGASLTMTAAAPP